MTHQEQAEQLAGRHYYCEDCWYSCPKAEDGCCDKSQGTECNCGYEKRVAEIRAALDAAEQRGAARGTQWQPMETAKPGQWLVHHREGGIVVRWLRKSGRWEDVLGNSVGQPTHWQPLPSPPQAASSTEEGA